MIVIGLAADAALAVLGSPESLWLRSMLMAAAVVLNALATGMYIGAGFGRRAARWADDRDPCADRLVNSGDPHQY